MYRKLVFGDATSGSVHGVGPFDLKLEHGVSYFALLAYPGARDLWSVKIPLTHVGW